MRSRSLCPPPSPPGTPRATSEVSAHRRAQTAHPLLIARAWAGRPAAKPACPPHPLPSLGFFILFAAGAVAAFKAIKKPLSLEQGCATAAGCRQPGVLPASPRSRDEIHAQGSMKGDACKRGPCLSSASSHPASRFLARVWDLCLSRAGAGVWDPHVSARREPWGLLAFWGGVRAAHHPSVGLYI